jgi:hypothetical protein
MTQSLRYIGGLTLREKISNENNPLLLHPSIVNLEEKRAKQLQSYQHSEKIDEHGRQLLTRWGSSLSMVRCQHRISYVSDSGAALKQESGECGQA